MSKRILITGAGSGFGRGAALELARRGHTVTAGAQIAPQATELLADAAETGVDLNVVVLDVTDETDRQAAFANEIDVLINNAGIMEAGPVAEIPMDRVRPQLRDQRLRHPGHVPRLRPPDGGPGLGQDHQRHLHGRAHHRTFRRHLHLDQARPRRIDEGLKAELVGTGVEVCTVNPGVYGTGFNDRGGETMFRWFDPATSTTVKPELFQAFMAGAGLNSQLDPQGLIDGLVRIAEEEGSKFRNVIPEEIVPWIQAIQANTWTAGRNDALSSTRTRWPKPEATDRFSAPAGLLVRRAFSRIARG